MTKPRILVVDDRTTMVGLVVRVLEDFAETVAAASVREATTILERDRIDAVVCDLRLPDGDGLLVLQATRRLTKPPPFVLITAFATVDTAVAAMRAGAADYVTKPFDPDELRGVVVGALSRAGWAGDENASSDRSGPLVGRSPKMMALIDLVRRVAATETTVLLLGETGTGKELVARALHDLSPRAAKPFLAINCAAIPRDLLEAELFGHVRGTFTGAQTDRAGLFETAEGSTLLLDEIGDLRLSLQAKLTRVLETRTVRRIGDTKERPVDVRIVAATHQNLKAASKEGRFREDLFYRLDVCSIEIPPLRDRKEDIPLLAAHFLGERAPVVGSKATAFSPEVIQRLVAYDWPGNVRELRSVIERAALLEPGERIEVASLPADIRGDAELPPVTDEYLSKLDLRNAHDLARDEMNRRYLTVLLRKHAGDVASAASAAGVERESIYRLLRKYGLSAGAYRERPVPKRRRGGGDDTG